jgi:peptide-methionine (S)-S-oxide reductase
MQGSTGYVEVLHVEYEGGDAYFEEMVRYFFQFHDPTTQDKQGNDEGTQYASIIYCYTPMQVLVANKVKDQLQQLITEGSLPQKCYREEQVKTDIRMAEGPFYPAHDEHQEYLMKNPRGYCNHRIRFKDWPKPDKEN